MSRVETIGDATLYLGDCREILPSISGIDAVLTDPPYGMNKDFANDAPEIADPMVSEVMAWCKQHAAGNVLAFWSAQRLDAIERVFQPKRVMIWNKTFAIYAPNNVGYRYEPIVWVSGREANSKRGDIFESFPIAFKAQAENASHPTQKPIELMAELVRDFTRAGSTILDPFMGSGTTGVAAVKFGRQFVGIEAKPEHFDTSCKRISEALKQPDMLVQLERRSVEIQQDMLVALEQPDEYDAEKDFGGSINDCYAAIRERVAQGGPGWEPKK